MRIVIDEFINTAGRLEWQQVLHTDVSPWNKVAHPTLPATMIDVIAWLPLLSASPALQASAGYHVINQITGESVPQSRWARIVAAASGPLAEPALKALNLV